MYGCVVACLEWLFGCIWYACFARMIVRVYALNFICMYAQRKTANLGQYWINHGKQTTR
eukprot:m.98227 g.98227  ORF g.98227 m.98227 type:complete len:59 (-) comp9003_c3_seq1:938-1114(-)